MVEQKIESYSVKFPSNRIDALDKIQKELNDGWLIKTMTTPGDSNSTDLFVVYEREYFEEKVKYDD